MLLHLLLLHLCLPLLCVGRCCVFPTTLPQFMTQNSATEPPMLVAFSITKTEKKSCGRQGPRNKKHCGFSLLCLSPSADPKHRSQNHNIILSLSNRVVFSLRGRSDRLLLSCWCSLTSVWAVCRPGSEQKRRIRPDRFDSILDLGSGSAASACTQP